MRNKTKVLAAARLYLVLDRQVAGYEKLFDIMKRAVPAGVDVVQLRDKQGEAKEIAEFSRKVLQYLRGKIPFIVNDRLDIAKFVGNCGVHLGQNDFSVPFARRILGPRAIIGISCQSLAQARQAQRAGADYLGFGPVFKTPIKPECAPLNLSQLREVNAKIGIPVFAIGGIDVKNVERLTVLGVSRVAVIRAICAAKDVAAATKQLKGLLTGKS